MKLAFWSVLTRLLVRLSRWADLAAYRCARHSANANLKAISSRQ